jgi:hypothetical protein
MLYPFIKDSIKSFFNNSQFSDDCIMQMELSVSEKLFLETQDYKVFIKGRLDLLISDQNTNHIIDIKTGHTNKNQLYLYEWLLDSDKTNKLYFFNVFEAKPEKPIENKDNAINDLKLKVQEVLEKCLQNGYYCKSNFQSPLQSG